LGRCFLGGGRGRVVGGWRFRRDGWVVGWVMIGDRFCGIGGLWRRLFAVWANERERAPSAREEVGGAK